MKIPQQLLAPIVGVLAGCFGIGVGLIIRQPEINELHRQVAKLQKKADELKETSGSKTTRYPPSSRVIGLCRSGRSSRSTTCASRSRKASSSNTR